MEPICMGGRIEVESEYGLFDKRELLDATAPCAKRVSVMLCR